MYGDLAFQEERREQLIDGKIVMMSPASTGHTYVSDNIYRIFGNYLHKKKCIVFGDGLLVHLSEKDKFVPDVMVICDRSKIKYSFVDGPPDLVVEVLSPSTARFDRGYKKSVYERCGVAEYWIVEPVRKSVEVYLLDDGHYVLDNLYTLFSSVELDAMSDVERAAVVTEFKCHLFDDLVIHLDDIFGDLF